MSATHRPTGLAERHNGENQAATIDGEFAKRKQAVSGADLETLRQLASRLESVAK